MIGELAGPHSNVGMSYAPMSTRPRSTFHAEVAVHVVGVHALRSEPRDDDAAVGGGRRARVRGLDVPLVRAARPRARRAPTRSCRSACRSRRSSSAAAIDRPSIAVAVEAGLERRVRIAADGARHEDAIAPDDRARVREPGNRRAPEDVLARRRRSRCRAAADRRRRRRRCGPRNDGQLPRAFASAGGGASAGR